MLFVKNPSKISVNCNLLVIKLERICYVHRKTTQGKQQKTGTNCNSI